jgi:hypothetical protein
MANQQKDQQALQNTKETVDRDNKNLKLQILNLQEEISRI